MWFLVKIFLLPLMRFWELLHGCDIYIGLVVWTFLNQYQDLKPCWEEITKFTAYWSYTITWLSICYDLSKMKYLKLIKDLELMLLGELLCIKNLIILQHGLDASFWYAKSGYILTVPKEMAPNRQANPLYHFSRSCLRPLASLQKYD